MIQQPSQILQGLHNIHPEQLCYGRNSAGVEYYEFSCVYPILESWYMRYVFIIIIDVVVVCCCCVLIHPTPRMNSSHTDHQSSIILLVCLFRTPIGNCNDCPNTVNPSIHPLTTVKFRKVL